MPEALKAGDHGDDEAVLRESRMKWPSKWMSAVLAVVAVAALLAVPLPRPVNLTTRIATVISIERPDTVVFDYVTTPAHWPRWHPSSLSVRGAIDHSLNVGEQVAEEFRVAGRRGSVLWTVAVRDRPRKWAIVGTIDGKPAGTVSYALTPVASGTRFEREFVYRAPTLWFAVLNVLFVRTRIQQESDEAVARLKKALETMP
ncbi:uncharacterized protein YndB with AHSA1/START domain [Paraburkholderia youngii]